MNKYIIEGGLDFYEELYKSLDINETIEKTEEDNNLCLITNQTLTEKFVELNCGHKFNYGPIFLDLKNHKLRFNGMEGSSGKLNTNEIRCPYCRTKQTGVLPYYKELCFPKINGVNDINPYSNEFPHTYKTYKKCSFKTPNPNYDPLGSNPVETTDYNTGNCQYHVCLSIGTFIGQDENNYCWKHKKILLNKIKDDLKQKAKDDAKKAKDDAKLEAKKAKDDAKLEAKKAKLEAKLEAKKAKQNVIQENIVLGQLDLSGNTIITGCVQILKSGQNKGNHCGCKVIMENLCNRHLKIKHGIEIQ
jgi:hypothetical protein